MHTEVSYVPRVRYLCVFPELSMLDRCECCVSTQGFTAERVAATVIGNLALPSKLTFEVQ